jgi:hypothetical protein
MELTFQVAIRIVSFPLRTEIKPGLGTYVEYREEEAITARLRDVYANMACTTFTVMIYSKIKP